MSSFLRMIIDQILVKFNVHYLELSSTHSAKERVDIVEQFNTDESIRVLILTTAVGGLGLTLTGADTVIFAEHDWNPMRDL
jgi:TATA-binding protein-associated factor